MNETLKVLENRRSCRKFKNDMITKEELDAILRAGTFAPSGHNNQASIIIAITNKDVIGKLARENSKIAGWQEDFNPFYGAPVVVAVLADKKVPTYLYDGSLVMGNMLNAAESLGVASIWIHRAKEVFESPAGKEILTNLGVTGDYEGIGFCALGYQEGEKLAAKPRKENYIYYVK